MKPWQEDLEEPISKALKDFRKKKDRKESTREEELEIIDATTDLINLWNNTVDYLDTLYYPEFNIYKMALGNTFEISYQTAYSIIALLERHGIEKIKFKILKYFNETVFEDYLLMGYPMMPLSFDRFINALYLIHDPWGYLFDDEMMHFSSDFEYRFHED